MIWAVKHSRTPISESSPHCKSATPGKLVYLRDCARSMSMVHRSLKQEHWGHKAKMFLINYPNLVVWVNIINSLPLSLNGYLPGALSWLSRSACSWKGYTPHARVCTLSFSLVCLTFLIIWLYLSSDNFLLKSTLPIKTLSLLLMTFRWPPMDENLAYWSASF